MTIELVNKLQEKFKCKIGEYCVIDPNVQIGKGTKIMNYVELRVGTVIGENCYIDSGVKMSGECEIGDDTTVRYDAIIARGTRIGADCYICPQVMFNNLDSEGEKVGGAWVGQGTFIGTNSTIQHGIRIAPHTTIGSKSLVLKTIILSGETWVGIPAKQIK